MRKQTCDSRDDGMPFAFSPPPPFPPPLAGKNASSSHNRAVCLGSSLIQQTVPYEIRGMSTESTCRGEREI